MIYYILLLCQLFFTANTYTFQPANFLQKNIILNNFDDNFLLPDELMHLDKKISGRVFLVENFNGFRKYFTENGTLVLVENLKNYNDELNKSNKSNKTISLQDHSEIKENLDNHKRKYNPYNKLAIISDTPESNPDYEAIERHKKLNENSETYKKRLAELQSDNDDQPTKAKQSDGPDGEYTFDIIKKPTHTFKDIGGYDKIKDELLQVIDSMMNSDYYEKFGIRQAKGLILYGNPGNGKTLMVKGLAGEINSTLISVSGSEFTEIYSGQGAKRVRKLFEVADKHKPCVIFIDEIDAVGRKRSNGIDGSNSEKDQTLNQLLTCLDGFKDTKGIFLIGATNRLDMLDPALIRAGRIDKTIFVDNPDKHARQSIIKIHTKKKPLDRQISIENLVELTGGFSSAQIENLFNEAMLRALRKKREYMTFNDIEHISNRILSGYQSTKTNFSELTLEKIIVHELGHAYVGFLSPNYKKLEKVVINLWSPTSPGFTKFHLGDQDIYINTKDQIMTKICVLLAGRTAEEVFFGTTDVTTGATQDYEEAIKLAETMVLMHAMGRKNVYSARSEKTKEYIDDEIYQIIEECRRNVLEIINDCRKVIQYSIAQLKRDEKMYPEDLRDMIHVYGKELLDKYTLNI